MEIRTVQYYKIIKSIIINGDFEIKEGTKVLFNFAEGQIYNVQLVQGNEKRFFWVHSSNLKHFKTVKEKWLKKDIEKYNIDLNDKWFEFDKQKQNKKNIKNVKVKKTTGRNKPVAKSNRKTNSKQSARTKDTGTTIKRTIHKAGVSTTKRKATVKKTKNI